MVTARNRNKRAPVLLEHIAKHHRDDRAFMAAEGHLGTEGNP